MPFPNRLVLTAEPETNPQTETRAKEIEDLILTAITEIAGSSRVFYFIYLFKVVRESLCGTGVLYHLCKAEVL